MKRITFSDFEKIQGEVDYLVIDGDKCVFCGVDNAATIKGAEHIIRHIIKEERIRKPMHFFDLWTYKNNRAYKEGEYVFLALNLLANLSQPHITSWGPRLLPDKVLQEFQDHIGSNPKSRVQTDRRAF